MVKAVDVKTVESVLVKALLIGEAGGTWEACEDADEMPARAQLPCNRKRKDLRSSGEVGKKLVDCE